MLGTKIVCDCVCDCIKSDLYKMLNVDTWDMLNNLGHAEQLFCERNLTDIDILSSHLASREKRHYYTTTVNHFI